jgi:hypothetical protein
MDAKQRYALSLLSPEARIKLQTETDPKSGCILWTGLKDKNGYGKIHCMGKHWRAHRLVYHITRGPIPAGRIIQHTCDTPSCCNIEHLRLGTWLSNMQDKVQKGRLRNQHMGKTHCKYGHEFSADNTRVYDGKRVCYTCLSTKRNYLPQRPKKNGLATICRKGHEYTPENTKFYACRPNVRFCVKCEDEYKVRRRLRESTR